MWIEDAVSPMLQGLVGLNGDPIRQGDAAVLLQKTFGCFARRLRPKDHALQDDLVQEMSLAVLESGGSHNLAFFRRRGLSRAVDYLRSEMVERKRLSAYRRVTRDTVDPEVLEERRDQAASKLRSHGMGFLLEMGLAA